MEGNNTRQVHWPPRSFGVFNVVLKAARGSDRGHNAAYGLLRAYRPIKGQQWERCVCAGGE